MPLTQSFMVRSLKSEGASRSRDVQTETLSEVVQRQGPFALGKEQYTVVLHKRIIGSDRSPAESEAVSLVTLDRLEIVDTEGNVAYQEAFPVVPADGRFSGALAALATPYSGMGATR